jgi:hypothetical protein
MRRMFLAFLLLVLPATAQAKALDPLKPGPYPVGVTTTVFVDYKRTDVATKDRARSLLKSGIRLLMTRGRCRRINFRTSFRAASRRSWNNSSN